jgi:hypothetical protein
LLPERPCMGPSSLKLPGIQVSRNMVTTPRYGAIEDRKLADQFFP